MPSDFLTQFHKEHFPDGKVPIYSKNVFYKLLEELRKQDGGVKS